ncbi:MAG: VOC family protein [Deltaproteobacteria bacterium]|nr:VOC family protein [Deltaproteobacteria bacterium]
MAMPLHHVALGAADVAGLAAFYGEAFGLAEVARHHEGDGALRSIWLELGGSLLMIEHSTEPERRVQLGRGPFLLAFRIEPGARASFERTLEERGVVVESRTSFSSYFRDPEGNRVAVSHHPEPSCPP